jgi:general secretion pathway protein E/type IV pilus assembly protein PilB
MSEESTFNEVLQAISSEQAWHYLVFPEKLNATTIYFKVDESVDLNQTKSELEMVLDKEVILTIESSSQIKQLLNKHYRKTSSSKVSITADDDYDEGFVSKLISESKELGSSDIHIETYDDKARIRLRIDGALIEKYKLNQENYNGLVSVIKLKSGMDIAERRKPQDGRYTHVVEDEAFDLRVSVLPTLRGEKVVMRILSNDASNLDLNAVGFSEKELKDYKENIFKPEGIILISGPTGSGKTTTLYATLKELNLVKRNIMTVEDPVEYTLEGINQVQVKEDIGLTFASTLRSFLRQDPDVIMLGEIRDEVTASMAIRAALTGHLVLSTIHTNSAWEITSRLVDMGVPDFLVAGTLKMAVAQRLIRKLCESCKVEDNERIEFPSSFKSNVLPEKKYKPCGCEDCYYTGYKGRKAIYEVIPIDREFAESIKTNSRILADNKMFKDKNIKLLADSAYQAFLDGETSFEEIFPILASNF